MLILSLTALLGIAGLALDLGHAFLNKTRLQNAVDAAALSGAKTLNQHRSTLLASSHALQTFNAYIDSELNDPSLTPTLEFSDSLSPFIPGGLNPRFIRVSLANFTMPVMLANILPGVGDMFTLKSSSVAGPMSLGGGEICDVAPLFVCGDISDTNCSDGSCYGLEIGDEREVCLKTGSSDSGNGNGNGNGNGVGNWKGQQSGSDEECADVEPGIGPGNFQLLSLDCGNGANCVREAMSGAYQGCITIGGSVSTKPGNTVGPTADGFNTRFGQYKGGMNSVDHPQDLVTTNRDDDPDFWYRNYLGRYVNQNYDNPETGRPGRRIMAVPIGSCDGTVNGRGEVQVSAVGCFYLTRPASHQGNTQAIYGQLIGDCEVSGEPPALPTSGPTLETYGTYKIVLYKDPFSDES
ncbi:MAG: Tad domain-containing protein [Gammaproteobacteria bacterium]|nr:Tad domain-containing protein [Gammaproteobacteria bacterium]